MTKLLEKCHLGVITLFPICSQIHIALQLTNSQHIDCINTSQSPAVPVLLNTF